jgi:hypothetical protein
MKFQLKEAKTEGCMKNKNNKKREAENIAETALAKPSIE